MWSSEIWLQKAYSFFKKKNFLVLENLKKPKLARLKIINLKLVCKLKFLEEVLVLKFHTAPNDPA